MKKQIQNEHLQSLSTKNTSQHDISLLNLVGGFQLNIRYHKKKRTD